MKIAYFLDIPSGLGGAGNVLLEQAKIMSKIYEVIVVIPCSETGKMNEEYERRCKKAGIRTRAMNYKTAFLPQNIDIIAAMQSTPTIRQFVLTENIDILHSVQINTAVEIVSRELHVPHLMNIYQLRDEEFCIKDEGIIPTYHSCDSFLYCNQWNRNWGMESKCIRPAAPAIHYQKIKLNNDNKLKILMLGDVCKRKNHLSAIQAIEYCKQKELKVVLTIAGNDCTQYAEECRRYITCNNLSDRIYMSGFQSEIEPLLKDNDCLLCASVDESFPSSIVEAMAYDLTIISTPVAGVPELLTNKKNAFICSGFSAYEITKSIKECIVAYQNQSIEKIHHCAKCTLKKNFSKEVVREKLNDYYCYMLDKYLNKENEPRKNYLIFEESLDIYHSFIRNKIDESYILQRCFYYAYLKKNLNIGKVYIWGAGKYGKLAKQLLKLLFNRMKLLAYIDSKKTGKYLGVPVIKSEEIRADVDYIFLGFAGEKEQVIEQLEGKGFKYNKNIWIFP